MTLAHAPHPTPPSLADWDSFNFDGFDDGRDGPGDDEWQVPEFGERAPWVEKLSTWVRDPSNQLTRHLAVDMVLDALAAEPIFTTRLVRPGSLHLVAHWYIPGTNDLEDFLEKFWREHKTRLYGSTAWQPLGISPEQLPIILDRGDVWRVISGPLLYLTDFSMRAQMASGALKIQLRDNRQLIDQVRSDLLQSQRRSPCDLQLEIGSPGGMDAWGVGDLKAEVFVQARQKNR